MPHTRSPLLAFVTFASTTVFAFTAVAQQMALAPAGLDCPSVEPDSVQISWTAPCEEGNWLLDTQAGCRMWDWHPAPKDRAVWNASCPKGVKQGVGVIQWYEHGQPIDRFEGTYRDNKREGFGRYAWNETERFEGTYKNDVPHGTGTAILAGQTFTGQWKNGCLSKGDRVVAIGVSRASCAAQPKVALNP